MFSTGSNRPLFAWTPFLRLQSLLLTIPIEVLSKLIDINIPLCLTKKLNVKHPVHAENMSFGGQLNEPHATTRLTF